MKVTELRNQHIAIARVPQPGEELWSMTFTDRNSGDVIWLAISAQVKAELVRMMTGGIVVANGKADIPQ